MYSSPLHRDPRLPVLYTLYSNKRKSQERIRALKKRIQSTQDALQLEELKCRKRVLRRLGFTTSADIVDVKGRVACEISSGDELLLTELIFDGVFNTLEPDHCAALLSCFVFDEKVRMYTLYFPFLLNILYPIERARDQGQRGIGGSTPHPTRDGTSNRKGVQGVKIGSRRRRLC